MHATIANDTSVSEFCTEQGFWASIKPMTRHLYVNPEGQLRAQVCKILLGQLTAVARSWRPYSGMNPSLGCKFGVQATVRTSKSLTVGFRPLPDWTPVLTLDDRRRFAFGAGDSKHRTRAEIDAVFRRLPGLVVVSEAASNDRTGEVGWIVIPKAAAAVAAPKSEGRPEPEHANRGK